MLWATGCSQVYGDDLTDKTKAWPYVLADMLGLQCKNNGVSGSSNERIVYETVKSNPASIKIIAWTFIERFTRYDPDNNFEVNFNPGLTNDYYGKEKKFIDYANMHYKYWYNDLYAFKNWLQQIIMLQRFLKDQPYVMINSHPNRYKQYTSDWKNFNNSIKDYVCFDYMNDDQLYEEHCEIKHYVDLIDTRCYYNLGSFYLRELEDIYPLGPTGHLIEEGHQEIAKRLYPLCSKLIR